jgi:CRP/FNR family transcriptional regulator, cyclic AMP receptor protein
MAVSMNWIEACGYAAAFLTLGTFAMTKMIPLRIAGIAANFAFIAYGALAPIYPVLGLHAILLPLNALRLYQMLQLIRTVANASQGDLNFDWLKPFMSRRACMAGETIFRKGELASAMFYILSGRFWLSEIAQEVPPGEVIGDLGLIAPDNKRTLTLECLEDGELMTISYSSVKQLYFQNPKFGFYFLELTSRRLFQDIARLEQRLAAST